MSACLGRYLHMQVHLTVLLRAQSPGHVLYYPGTWYWNRVVTKYEQV